MSFSAISVKPHLLAHAFSACVEVCACVTTTHTFSIHYLASSLGWNGKRNIVKTIVNLLQKYLGSLTDIYMKVNE